MHNDASPSPRVVELDALRGLAALAVVAFHYTTQYGLLFGHAPPLSFGFPLGNYGVNLFFLISGFVIFMTLERTRTAMDFVVSRFSRLFPAYWAAIGITALVVYTIGMPQQRLPWQSLLLNLTMMQQVLGGEHLDGSYWTLQVELFFYVQMLGWWSLGQLKRIHLVIVLWLALAVYYAMVVQHHHHFSYLLREFLIIRHIPFFAMGILFYRLRTHPGQERLNYALVALSLLAVYLMDPPVFLWVGVGCCVIFMLFNHGLLAWLRNGLFAYLGSISYSLYLLHQAIGFAVIRLLERAGLHSLAACLTALLCVLLLASALTYGVERPAMRRIRRWWRLRNDSGALAGPSRALGPASTVAADGTASRGHE